MPLSLIDSVRLLTEKPPGLSAGFRRSVDRNLREFTHPTQQNLALLHWQSLHLHHGCHTRLTWNLLLEGMYCSFNPVAIARSVSNCGRICCNVSMGPRCCWSIWGPEDGLQRPNPNLCFRTYHLVSYLDCHCIQINECSLFKLVPVYSLWYRGAVNTP
jgi:hypothetical protein